MFKAVMHGNIWPAADVIDYAGRLAFRWTYSVAEWRHRGRRKFAKLVREAAAKELAEADYSTYDLSPLRCLIGDDGGRFRRLLRAGQNRSSSTGRSVKHKISDAGYNSKVSSYESKRI